MMKTLLPFLVLATLVSCGEKNKNKNMNNDLEKKFMNAISSIQRGQSSTLVTSGKVNLLSFEGDGGLNIKPIQISLVQRDVVLKVENGKVYTYKESRDTIRHTTSRSVELQAFNPSEARNPPPDTKVFGNLVTSTSTSEEVTDLDNGNRHKHTENMTMILDITKVICDYTLTFEQVDIIIFPRGEESRVGPSKAATVSTCGAVVSTEKLKEIDLSSIEFCDESSDDNESACETDKDMSFLTSDL